MKFPIKIFAMKKKEYNLQDEKLIEVLNNEYQEQFSKDFECCICLNISFPNPIELNEYNFYSY
jgi:hypothetical protein